MKRFLFFALSFLLGVTTFAQPLYKYIDKAYKEEFFSPVGCKDFFDYKIIDSSIQDQTKIYYLVLYIQGYKIDKGFLQECGSTFTPAALNLYFSNGQVVKQKLLLPNEGEDYAASIRNIFPKHLQKKMFEHYKLMDVAAAKNNTLKKAMKYFDLYPVKIYYPSDMTKYEKLMDQYFNGEISNPLDRITFKYDVVYLQKEIDIEKKAALMAYKKYPPFGNTNNADIVYFRHIKDTVYILLNADIDGWAGVSLYLAKVRPIIEKTLLQFDDINKVIWDKAPDDK